MKSNSLKPHQVAIIAAGLASVVLWAIPALNMAMLPLQYLNTHLHELCHALAAQATGGTAHEIQVFANGSGVTPISGGSIFISASAGYVGAAIIGALIMATAKSERSAKTVLRVIAIVLGFGMIMWVRGDVVGVISGIAWFLGLFAISSWATGPKLLFAAQFIGLQQALNAVQSLYDLLRISAFTERHSDARIMQEMTHLPAVVWAAGWCVFSLAMIFIGLRSAWRTASLPSRPAG